MKTIYLGDADTVQMFALAGMEGYCVEDATQALAQMKQIIHEKKTGLVVVSQKVAAWVPELIAERRFSRDLPLVLDIPDYQEKQTAGQSLENYIREAVGIKI